MNVVGRKATFMAPSAVRCGLLILIIKLALSQRGLGWTLERVRRRVRSIAATTRADCDVVRSVERSVALAGALYPGRALCLEQSIVLYYLLRRRGIAAEFCLGAQAYPLLGHAWVEYRGQVINDVSEHVAWFAKFPAILP